jgi:dihydrofolate reductase
MADVCVFIACSLDGFIAGPDDDLSWLPPPDPAGEDYGFAAFMGGMAALLMGRRTYDIVAAFPEWPYGELPVFVATSRPIAEPRASTVRAVSGTPAELLAAVTAGAPGPVYLDGGALIRSFLAEGLVHSLVVTVVPVVLGAGIPLFAGTAGPVQLELRAARPYPSGLVQLEYIPAAGAALNAHQASS